MTITNGYATLNEVKQAMSIANTYTAITISFDTTADTIADSAYGLKRFQAGDIIHLTGSTSNDGYHTIDAASGNSAASFTVDTNLTTEIAGDTVIITVADDQQDDAAIERAINSASRWIDKTTGTRFYRNSADETRVYTCKYHEVFFCPDDIGSITTLKTDEDGDGTFEITWTVATDYRLKPANAVLDGEPYTSIVIGPNGSYTFPSIDQGLQLIGKFGYSASTPDEVNSACIILAQRALKRKDAPLGVMGNVTVGYVQLQHALDPDVENYLTPWLTRRAYG